MWDTIIIVIVMVTDTSLQVLVDVIISKSIIKVFILLSTWENTYSEEVRAYRENNFILCALYLLFQILFWFLKCIVIHHPMYSLSNTFTCITLSKPHKNG